MIFNQMHYSMNTSMNSSSIIRFITEVLLARTLLILCNMKRMTYQLVNTFILSCRDWDNRNTQKRFHGIDSDRAPISSDFIHHVKSKNHWYIQFYQLHCEIEIPLYIHCINYIYYTLRFFTNYILSRYYLLICIWRQ